MFKKKVLLCIFIMFISMVPLTFGTGTWEIIRQGDWKVYQIYDVFFIDSVTGWAACSNGTVAYTEDGGDTWTLRRIWADENIVVHSLYFVDKLEGWAVGSLFGTAHIWHTEDGGVTWASQYQMFDVDFTDVQFLSEKSGWVMSKGALIQTKDGGQTWDARTVPYTISMFFVTPDEGWLIGLDGWAYYSKDGFASIASSWKFSSQLNDIFFTDKNNGWIVGGKGSILHTTNGGQLWQVLDSGTTGYLNKVFFVEDTGWISSGNSLLHTEDGGRTWETLPLPMSPTSFHFADKNRGWFVGGSGLAYRTKDGGRTWTPLTKFSESLHKICFVNETTGWALGKVNLFYTDDGGEAWSAHSFEGEWLTAMFFLDENRGWVHSAYHLWATQDGGKTWSKGSGEKDVSSIYFVNDRVGWKIVRESIYKTVDSGMTWQLQFKQPGIYPTDIFFVTPTDGWAVWNNGILHTSNGVYWEVQAKNWSGARAVYFANPDEGWVTGEGGLILHTTDGGQSWIRQSSRATNSLRDVLFINPKVGFIVGEGGLILHTTDGGWTWEIQDSGTDIALYSLSYGGGKYLFASGEMGTALKYEDAELTGKKPILTLKPDFGKPGSAVQILGEGYAKGANVKIYLGEILWGEALTNTDGKFHIIVVVPELPSGIYPLNTADVKPGYATWFRTTRIRTWK